MRNRFLLLTAVFIASVALSAQVQPPSSVDPESKKAAADKGIAAATDTAFNGTSWWNYVKVLASDDMEAARLAAPACARRRSSLSNS